MPVLLEMTSLVLPAPVLAGAGAPGARAGRLASSVSGDGELVALSFDALAAAGAAVRELERAGVAPMEGGEPGPLALVDQVEGPLAWWPWLELARVEVPRGGMVLAGRLAGGASRVLALPAGWSFAGSASEEAGVGALSPVDRPLRHLRREPAGDLYVDRWTGEEVRVRRARPRARVVVHDPRGGGGELEVEVAARWPEIELGLMFRDALPEGEGMLFRFGVPRDQHFWMKNTRVPLDVLFVDEKGRVVNVAEHVEPLRLRRVASAGPVPDVLEARAGWCAAHGVGPGARVEVATAEAPLSGSPPPPPGRSRTRG